MQKLTCLIIEDEPLAAEGLASFIAQVPFLDLTGSCGDAMSAFVFLKNKTVDLIFLDIHLPKLKGLDFLKTLKDPPQVILTTAYHQYALKGYELNVVDYLLKPYGFSRFLAAVNKLKFPERQFPVIAPTKKEHERLFHFFNENKRNIKVYDDEILYVESLKEYVRIFLSDGRKVVTRFQIGEFEKHMQANHLLRIHRSFLVNIDKISAYSASEIEVGKVKLPIGRGYKMQVMGRLAEGRR
ncbi:MAG: LytTR family DNA-binding domain-containing protein [Bacteroidota bacterium]